MKARKSNLTNNKKTEKSDSVFQLMFEKHGAVMLLIDPQNGCILNANQSAVDFYGYSKEKLCNMLIGEINIMPQTQVEEEYQKAFREERNYFIFTHKLSNGEERTVEVHSSPIALEEKKVLFSIIHDITWRKRTEVALRESEEKVRSIIEYAKNGIVMTDEYGNVVEWNSAQSQITGLARSSVIGSPLWEAQLQVALPERRTPEVAKNLQGLFKQMLITGKVPAPIQEQEVKIQKVDGTACYIHSVIFSIKTASGFRLAGISNDITERKKLEQEIRAQRDFSTQIINTMGQGLTVTNAEGRFKFVNPAYARMFGYETKDLIGKYPQDVSLPEEHTLLAEQRELRKNGRTTSYESRLRRADGSVAQVLITGAPYESDGLFEGTIAVITDLTEQKRIEEELRYTRDKLVILHSELERSYAAEQQLARIDALTGINNRRSLFEFAERELNLAARYQQTLSVILFDIDNFKQINDTYGHLKGDQALTAIAQAAITELRTVDVIGRYGGDEFIILLPQTSSQDALALAERIHNSVSKIKIEVNQELIKLSVSIGITQASFQDTPEADPNKPTDTIECIILRADKALYAAKQTRNKRTVIFTVE